MSKENKLLDELVNLVIEDNKDHLSFIEDVINDINERLRKCAGYGYTTFLIQLTTNWNLLPDSNKVIILNDKNEYITTVILFTPNDAIKRKYTEYIKDYYEKEGLNVSNRHNNDDTLLISWNKNVLNHYGYEF